MQVAISDVCGPSSLPLSRIVTHQIIRRSGARQSVCRPACFGPWNREPGRSVLRHPAVRCGTRRSARPSDLRFWPGIAARSTPNGIPRSCPPGRGVKTSHRSPLRRARKTRSNDHVERSSSPPRAAGAASTANASPAPPRRPRRSRSPAHSAATPRHLAPCPLRHVRHDRALPRGLLKHPHLQRRAPPARATASRPRRRVAERQSTIGPSPAAAAITGSSTAARARRERPDARRCRRPSRAGRRGSDRRAAAPRRAPRDQHRRLGARAVPRETARSSPSASYSTPV